MPLYEVVVGWTAPIDIGLLSKGRVPDGTMAGMSAQLILQDTNGTILATSGDVSIPDVDAWVVRYTPDALDLVEGTYRGRVKITASDGGVAYFPSGEADTWVVRQEGYPHSPTGNPPIAVAAIPYSYLDADVTLAANSDLKVATQKATKAYVDAHAGASGVTSITGTANQVIASAATGAVTLSLPQSINSGAAPTFVGTNFSGTAASLTAGAATLAAAATVLATPRAIYGNNFDGSAALAQIIASTYGGTGNGFTKFSGPTTSEKTFTLPDANATLLYSGGALGTPSSGVATNLTGTAAGLTAGSATLAATATALATARAIYGNNFDGTSALGQIIASTYGGTGNGFTKFTGPTTSEKTFTLPDSSATLLYSGGALGTPSSGVATNLTGTASGLTAGTASAVAVGGITGLGTGVSTFLATPSSANLATAVTGETGSGALMFGTSPTITTLLTLNGQLLLGVGSSGSYGLQFNPTSGLTAGQTMFVQDATATTGQTTVIIKGGAVTGSLLELRDNGNNIRINMRDDGYLQATDFATLDGVSAALTANYGPGVALGSVAFVGWSSAAWYDTKDTGLSRISAGLIGIGTGAQGSFAGGLKLTNITHVSGTLGFNGATPAAVQTSGANLTNSVTAGGTDDTIANYTDLTLYATDAAAIRNNIYQLARKLKQINDGLRTYGLFT